MLVVFLILADNDCLLLLSHPSFPKTYTCKGWRRGPCACPRPGELLQRVSMKPWRNRHSPGQAQGPHPSPHPPLVPTERRGRTRPDGRDYPLRLATFIRTEADVPNYSPIRLSKIIR